MNEGAKDGMKVAVHARSLSNERLDGIGTFALNLLRALARTAPGFEFDLFSNRPFVHPIDSPNVRHRRVRWPFSWSYTRLPLSLATGGYDAYFAPNETMPFLTRPPAVVTTHDLWMIKHPEDVARSSRFHFYLARTHHLRAAARVVVPSKATRDDVVKLCGVDPARVALVPYGVDLDRFRPAENPDVARRYGLTRPYFLNASSRSWSRKNLERVVRAFKATGLADHQLVVTGQFGDAHPALAGLIASLGLAGSVIFTDYVPIEDMPVLMSGAIALVFPSLDEGFGLPILEAMACGCPVVTSNVSAMPEVAGDAAILVDPSDEASIAAAMARVREAAVREDLRRRGLARAREFTWDRTARGVLDVFESLR